MALATQQLEAVFQELTEAFTNDPLVTINPVGNHPPEQYDITYNIQGMCREESGDISPCDQHTISLTLPFGYPHFPPNCKPETSTFHPDFDPAAICLGDFWEENKSVADLIKHIGLMIAGQFFSRDNAFNEEAAAWFADNSTQLPFTDISFSSLQSEPDTLDSFEDALEIDTLDEDIFNDVIEIDESSGENFQSPPPVPDKKTSVSHDLDHYNSLIKQKRFQELYKELGALAVQGSMEGLEQLNETVDRELGRAEEIYQDADDLEHEGRPDSAMQKYSEVKNIVADFTNIDADIKRTKQSMELLGEWTPGDEIKIEDFEGDDSTPKQDTVQPEPIPKKKKKNTTFFEQNRKTFVRWIPITIAIIILGICATLGGIYYTFNSRLNSAISSFDQCKVSLEKNAFRDAEQQCKTATDDANTVLFIKQAAKKTLLGEIKAVHNSQKMRMGLKGKVLLDGKYVTTSTKNTLAEFKTIRQKADENLTSQNWEDALTAYLSALDIAAKTDAVDPLIIVEIKKHIDKCKFENFLMAGNKSLALSDWNAAEANFASALKIAKQNPAFSSKDLTQLTLLSEQTAFNKQREKGDELFSQSKWDSALAAFQEALTMGKKLELPQQSHIIVTLRENIVRTKVYSAINEGKKAFANSNWTTAINQYEKASRLLQDNKQLLAQINTEKSRLQLARFALHAAIIRDQQAIARMLEGKELELAITQIETTIATIGRSDFKNEKEFRALTDNLVKTQDNTQSELIVANNIGYLEENYEQLFTDNYSAAAASTLKDPKISFDRKVGKNMIFKMQCTEHGRGKSLLLTMYYQYNPKTDRWSFYRLTE